jgi:hypothetical protein
MIQQIPEQEYAQFLFQQLSPLGTYAFEVLDRVGQYLIGRRNNQFVLNKNNHERFSHCANYDCGQKSSHDFCCIKDAKISSKKIQALHNKMILQLLAFLSILAIRIYPEKPFIHEPPPPPAANQY